MKVSAFVMMSVVALTPPAVAQDLTVDELVTLALERSPVLLATRAGVDVAGGQLVEAGLRKNVMVSSSRQEMLGGSDAETMVGVEWPLDLYRRSARVASARQAAEIATLSAADRERLVAASVRAQAGRVLEARRSQALLEQFVVTTRDLRDLAEARAREGAAPRLEPDILRVELQRAEAELAAQSGQAEMALIELKALAGLEPGHAMTLRGELENEVRPGAAPDGGGRSAIGQRADVREALARVSLAEARLGEVRADARIDGSLFGEYARMSSGFPQRAFDAAGAVVPIQGVFSNVRVGVRLTLPVLDRNQGAIAAVTAERRRAEHEATASRLAADAEMAVADTRARAAGRVVETYGGVRDQARRNLEVVRETYLLGSTTLASFLSEQRRFLDVEMAYTRALAEAFQARVAVRRASGD